MEEGELREYLGEWAWARMLNLDAEVKRLQLEVERLKLEIERLKMEKQDANR